MNRADYTLIGIATIASLLILIPLGVGLADAQISNSTISVTNSTGTFDVPAFTNSTGTYLMSELVPPPVPEPEPVVTTSSSTPSIPILPTGSLSVQKYVTPTFPDEYYIQDDLFKVLAKRTTVGSNYDLVEDYKTGEASWTSTINKIQDGYTTRSDGTGIPTFKNYVLQQSGQKVIFNSNSVGGLVYDLPTCSYSIKENGYNGQTVVPSVSAIATGLVNGEWTNLQVNDALCNVNITSDADGIIITSTKSVQLDPITVVNSFNGTSTQVPQSETFVQVLDVNSKSGIKETWKVWKTDDTPLGISQTVHTGSTIEIAGQVIDIEALNGQSFNKQYIVENEAEILAITDSVAYDFDEGIDSLTGINIIYDSDYKVNLDYASGDFTGYLEIDPTFTNATPNYQAWLYDSNNNNSFEDNPSSVGVSLVTSGQIDLGRVSTAEGNDGKRGVVEWDISSIGTGKTITDTTITFDMAVYGSADNCEFRALTIQPSTSTDDVGLWQDIKANTIYVDDSSLCASASSGNVLDLGTDADSDVTSNLSSGWFALGMMSENENIDSSYHLSRMVANPTLTLTYSVPVIMPDPPTSLTASDGLPIGLSWTAPSNFGSDGDGNAVTSLTGYKVARTQTSNSLLELPDNSGTNANLDFTNNELLIHGFEAGQAVTLDDDLSSETAWTENDDSKINVDTSTERLDFDIVLQGNDNAYRSIETGDSTWVLRYLLHFDTISTSSGSNIYFLVDISDDGTTAGNNYATGSIGLYMNVDEGSNNSLDLFANGASPATVELFVPVINTDYYVEIIKTSGTTATATVGTDSYGGTANGGSASISGLTEATQDTLSVRNRGTSSGSSGHSVVGYIDDFKWYNGVTSYDDLTKTVLTDKSTNNISVTSLGDMSWDSSSILNHAIDGATVTRDGGSGSWWDLWARTTTTFDSSVPQEITWTTNGGVQHMVGIGLETSAPSGSNKYTEVDFAMYKENTSNGVYILENGSFSSAQDKCTGVTFSPSNVYKISINTGGQVVYSIDGTTCYTSTNTASGTYYLTVIAYSGVSDIHSTTGGKVPSTASTTGVLGTGIQSPDLSFTDSNLPDGTDDFSIGSWVKLDPELTSTYETDFSTDSGWTSTDTNSIEITNNEIQYKNSYGEGKYIYYDLVSVDPDKWTLKFKMTPSGTASSDEPAFAFGIYDNIGDMDDSGDRLGMWMYFDRNNTWQRIYCTVSDSSTSVQGLGCTTGGDGSSSGTVNQSISMGSSYWIEMVRDGTTLTSKIFTTDDYTSTPLTTMVQPSIPSTLDNLQYLTASHYKQGSGITVVLDDVEFWNGVSSVPVYDPNTKLLGLNDVTFNVGTDSASVVSGTTSNAWSFSNNYVDLGDDILYDGNDLAIMANFKTVADSGDQMIVANWHTGTSGFQVYVDSNNQIHWWHPTGGSKTGSTTLNDNQWYNVIVNRVNNVITLYIDGVSEHSSSHSSTVNGNNMQIGGSNNVGTFEGTIDDVAIWSDGLSASEISALQTDPTPPTTSLLAHYTFEETTSLPDQAGNNDGTLNGQTTGVTHTPANTIIYAGEVTNSNSFTSISNPDVSALTLGGGSGSGNTKIGFEVFTGHTLVGKDLTSITFAMSKYGSVSGDGYVSVYDSSGNQKGSSSSTNDWGTLLQSTPVDYTFTWTTPITIANGDRIVLEGGSFNTGNQVDLYADNSSPVDSNTNGVYYNSGWASSTNSDVHFDAIYDITTGTALADNTSTAKNYVFTRDGNNWAIYQNGVSQATATDTTSLGANGITGFASQAVTWDSTTSSGVSISGNTITKTSGDGWTDGVAQSTQTISPSTGGGEVTFTKTLNNSMGGLSKDPYWTSGNTQNTGDYLMYDNAIQELGTVPSGNCSSTWSGGSDSTVHKITMDENGLVKYYVDGTLHCTSGVTASGTYYLQGSIYGTGDSVTGSITSYGIEEPYTTNISGMIDEMFINSDALTATEVNNISTRAVDAWSILSNPNDYALAQTDLPNNSVNESGSTGEEIDFTDNEFLIHGFEIIAGSTQNEAQNTDTFKRAYVGSGSGTSCPTGNAGVNSVTRAVWLDDSGSSGGTCSVAGMSWDISALPSDATVTGIDMIIDVSSVSSMSGVNGELVQMDSALSTWTDASVIFPAIQSETTQYYSGSDFQTTGTKTLTLNSNAVSDMNSVLSSGTWETALRFDTETRSSGINIATTLGNADLAISYTQPVQGLADKSTNSITVGTVAGGVLLSEQTQLDNDDQLNSNTIEDWGIVVGSSSPMVGEDIVQVDFYGKRYQLSGYNQMCEFEVLDSSDTVKYEHSFLCDTKFTTTAQWVSFDLATPTTISAGDRIVIHSEQGGATNYLNLWEATSDVDSGVHVAQGDHGAWNDDTGRDPAYKVYSANTVGTSTTGVISTGVQSPNLVYTNSNLPDNTDNFSVGSWVKLDMGTSTGEQIPSSTDGKGLGNESSPYIQEVGFQVLTGHELIGEELQKIQFKIYSYGSGFSATDTVYAKVYDSNLSTVRATSESVLVSDLQVGSPNTWQEFTFSSPVTIDADDVIVMSGSRSTLESGSGFTGNTREIAIESSNTSGMTNAQGKKYNGSWQNESKVSSAKWTVTTFPTNTKLLGLNDVTFSVGTTTASVDSLGQGTTLTEIDNYARYWEQGGSSGTSNSNQDCSLKSGSNPVRSTHSSGTQSAYLAHTGNSYSGCAMGFAEYDVSGYSNWSTTNSIDIEFDITDISNGGNPNPASVGYECAVRPMSGATNPITDSDTRAVWSEMTAQTEQVTWTCDSSVSTTQTNKVITLPKSFVDVLTSDTDGKITLAFVLVDSSGNFHRPTSASNGIGYWLSATHTDWGLTPTLASPIVSATGLSDNTSTAQHYTFTRDGNDWEIYQNAVSEATATDSTSLGSNGEQISVPSGSTYHQDFSAYSSTGVIGNAWQHVTNSEVAHTQVTACDNADWTAIMWYKSGSGTDTTTRDALWSWDASSVSAWIVVQNNKIGVGVYGGTAGNVWNDQYSSSLGDGQWHQVAVVNDGSTQTYEMFVDGTSDHSGTSDNYWASNSCFKMDTISTDSGSASNNGYYLDEFSYHNSKLTQAEIQATKSSPDYTTNIDGMIDEYFINSDVLTASEISDIDRRGETESPVTTTSTTLNDGTAVAGYEYWYKVYSVSSEGISTTASNVDNAMTVSLPNAPAGVTATNGVTQANVSWNASTDLGGGTTLAYKIYKNTNGGAYTILAQPSGTGTTYTDTVVTQGNTYGYKIVTVNEAGDSPQSSPATVIIGTVPDAPTLTTVTPLSGAQHTIDWTAPSNNGGFAVTGYEIERSTTSGSGFATVGQVGNVLTWTDPTANLVLGDTYYYRVLAINQQGTSVASNEGSGLTGDKPDAVANVTADALVNYEININWTPANENFYALTGYEVFASENGATAVSVGTTPQAQTQFLHTGLNSGSTYTYSIYATNSLGTSTISNQPSTVAGDIPGVPTNLTVTPVVPSQIDVAWGASAANGYTPTYTVAISTDSGSTWDETSHTGLTALTLTKTGLVNGQTYQYKISATNTLGTSAYTADVSGTAGDVPSTPVGLSVTTLSATELTFAWGIPNDNGYSLTGYKVERSDDNFATSTVLDANYQSNVYPDTGLTASTTYDYRVSAINALGTSPVSATSSGATFGVPDAVSNLALTTVSTSQINLTWSQPALNGYTFVEYQIERSFDGVVWQPHAATTNTTYQDTLNTNDNTEYHYRVITQNSYGFSVAGNAEMSFTTPTPPAALSATVQSDVQIDLAWNNPTGTAHTGFLIEQSIDSGTTWTTVITTTNQNLSYNAVGLIPLTDYQFRVSTVNQLLPQATGTSVPSPVATATTFGHPDVPTGLTATALPGSQIQLDWVAPTVVNGSPVTEYKIERSTDGGTTWGPLIANTGNLNITYTDTGLTTTQEYHYRVSAYNIYGVGNPGTEASAIASDVPSQVTGLTATPTINYTIDLSWTTPNGNGYAVSGYLIERNIAGAGWLTIGATTTSTATTYADINLAANTVYEYRVSAINVVGTGLVSATASSNAGDVPDAPVLTLTALPGSTIQLDWTVPTNNGFSITTYAVEKSTDGTNWSPLTSINANTFQDTGLTNASTYYYKVTAVNQVGNSVFSSPVSIVAGDAPSQVTGLTATTITNTSIDLAWTTPNANGYAVSGYMIESSIDYGNTWTTVTADTQSTSTAYAHTGLTTGEFYTYKISAINALGTGMASATAVTHAGDIPNVPALTLTALPNSIIQLDWTAPTDNGFAITTYQVEKSTDNGSTWTSLTSVNALTTQDTGLTNGNSYQYRVLATNTIGNSPFSGAVAMIAGDVPGALSVLTATTQSDTSISLTWTAPNANGYAITGYQIEQSTDGTTWGTPIVSNTQNTAVSYTVTGLNDSTDYYFKVTGINALGIGALGPVANAHTFGAPDPFIPLTSSSTVTSATVNWTQPYDHGSPITSYRVEILNLVNGIGNGQWLTLTTTGGLTNTHTGLQTNTEYQYRIVAINPYGSVTSPAQAITTFALPPTLTATAISGTAIDLTWPTVSGSTTYSVYSSANDVTFTLLQSGISATTYQATGLSLGQTAYYKVTVTNAAGESAQSTSATATTWSLPGTPTGLTITNPTPTTARFTWTAPTDFGGAPSVTYTLQRSTDNSNWTSYLPSSTTTIDDNNLTLGQQYYWRVNSVTTAGVSGNSNTVNYLTPTLPTAPGSLTAALTGANNNAAVLNWVAPISTSGYTVIGYHIEYNINGNGFTTLVADTGNSGLVYTNTGLNAGSSYVYRVSAITAVGEGVPSNTASVSPVLVTLSITGTATGGNSVSVSPTITTSGASSATIVQQALYRDNVRVDLVSLNIPLVNGASIPSMTDYPTQASSYVMTVVLDTGYVIQSQTNPPLTLTPSAPFTGEISFSEDRTEYTSSATCLAAGGTWGPPSNPLATSLNVCSLSFTESVLEFTVQPVGADVIISYQPQNLNEPAIVKAFTATSSAITETIDVDPETDYYGSIIVNPTFEYNINADQTIAVVCDPNDIMCDATDTDPNTAGTQSNVPKGVPAEKTFKSFKSPDSTRQLGIEPMGNLFGVNMVFIFVIALAGIFTGRSAPMGVIFILVTLGIMAFLGYLDFGNDLYNAATWALLIIAGILGIFLGKRWS
ncbi:fibronectin type III domain-containing protein [Nitrosopumilus sp.]|nr:fibronectin type III domain-containing protein [Nitrosopumilus sp.]